MSDFPVSLSTLSSLQFESAIVPRARLFSLHPSLVSDNSCRALCVGGMNSCGTVHDACVNSVGDTVRDACNNSGGHMNSDASARTNSCGGAYAHGGGPGMKTPRQCSGDQVRRPAVNNAPRTASVEYLFTTGRRKRCKWRRWRVAF